VFRRYGVVILLAVAMFLAVPVLVSMLPLRGVVYQLVIVACALGGVVSLVLASRRGGRDSLRLAGFLVGLGALALAASLLSFHWFNSAWLTPIGLVLMAVGASKARVRDLARSKLAT